MDQSPGGGVIQSVKSADGNSYNILIYCMNMYSYARSSSEQGVNLLSTAQKYSM
jgi:hypothetical protein